MEIPKPQCTLIRKINFNYKILSPANDGSQMRISPEKSKAQWISQAPEDSFCTAFKPSQHLGFSWTELCEERQRKSRIPGSTIPSLPVQSASCAPSLPDTR